MNKSELIEAVASELAASKTDAGKAVEAVIGVITKGIATDERVAISGFGTFQKKIRPARQGMNPATREPIQIAESTTCNFKPATALREAI